MFMLLIQVSLLALVVGQHIPIKVEVEIEPPPNLYGTVLTFSYCVASGRECPGANLLTVFAADEHQCRARCNRNFRCQLAFYNSPQCSLREWRCPANQLERSTGTSYYRLKKGETCSSSIPAYVDVGKEYSHEFCLIPDKSCPGHDLYRTPEVEITLYRECLKKCAMIKTCTSVDFDDKCYPKNYECPEKELVSTPGTDHYMRLEEGKTVCPCKEPIGHVPAPTEPPPPPPPPVFQGEEQRKRMVPGVRVKRGVNWKWDNEDGTPPGLGTVISEEDYRARYGYGVDYHKIAVRWDTGDVHQYRMKGEGEYDLQLA